MTYIVYELAEGVSLTQRDVRALQLAKAAMAAGMDSLLHAAGCPEHEVAAVYLAGGFGSHLNIASTSGWTATLTSASGMWMG